MSTPFTESTGNVFEDMGYPKDLAANLQVRTLLMIALRRHIKEQGLKQAEAAEVFGVVQPEISYLINKKIRRFSVDKLINMAANAGLVVDLRVTHPETETNLVSA